MSAVQPEGYNVTAVTTDDEGGFTTTWSDGRTSGPTVSIERAIIHRQRAKSIAVRLFLKRK
jgi:hypothetical protein